MRRHGWFPGLLAASLLMCAAAAHAQWSWLHPKPQGHNLYDVEFLTDTAAIAVGEAATIAVTNDGGSTWSYSPRTNGFSSTLWQVAAIDANTAVAVVTVLLSFARSTEAQVGHRWRVEAPAIGGVSISPGRSESPLAAAVSAVRSTEGRHGLACRPGSPSRTSMS